MSNKAKEIVRDFYESDILKDKTVLERYFHPEMVLIWNSPIGLSIWHYDELVNFFDEVRRSYHDLRLEVSHLLADGNHVTIRYKYYVRPWKIQMRNWESPILLQFGRLRMEKYFGDIK